MHQTLDIDDINAFHGESVSEFESNFHEVIDTYLVAAALGKAARKPVSRTNLVGAKS